MSIWGGLVSTPRPVPGKAIPAAAAALVLVLSLVVFLVAGWNVAAWAIGAAVWAAVFGLGLLLGHLRSAAGNNLASSGVLGLELMLKALVVLVVLIAVAASRPQLAVGAILVFALAYTAERALSLASYFATGPVR